MERLKFNVMGYGRGGTTYTSEYFKYLGWPIGHESIGEYGISSFMFVWNQNTKHRCLMTKDDPPRQRVDYEFEHNIHILRDPWLILSSNMGKDSFSQVISKVIGLDGGTRLEREMQSMTRWYWLTKEQKPDWTVKVEYLHFLLPRWLESKGMFCRKTWDDPPERTANTRLNYAPTDLDVRQLAGVKDSIMDDFLKYVRDAGYDDSSVMLGAK